MSRPSLAVIGAGAMGANHARVVAQHSDVDLGMVVDVDADRARAVADDHGAKWATDPERALAYDAAVVAVPTESHLSTVRPLLEAGRPVLVEKPIATTTADVRSLVDLAARGGVPFLCGFVERFNPVVQSALGLVDEPPVHLVALRHSPATPRSSIGVVHDLLIHDIDLAFLFARRRRFGAVQASRWRPPGGPFDEIADCTFTIDGGMVATLSASRAGQRKLRSLLVSTPDRIFELDLLRQDLTVYRHVAHELVTGEVEGYRAETVVDIPFIRHAGEPLALQLSYFLDLMEGRVDAARERDSVLAPHAVAELVERDTVVLPPGPSELVEA
jgi:predicted dehydrogenase